MLIHCGRFDPIRRIHRQRAEPETPGSSDLAGMFRLIAKPDGIQCREMDQTVTWIDIRKAVKSYARHEST